MVVRYGKNKALPFSVLKFHVRFRGRRFVGLRCETFLDTALLAIYRLRRKLGQKFVLQSSTMFNTTPTLSNSGATSKWFVTKVWSPSLQ